MTSAVEGAHSIYRFIERTMERTPEGARWQTIDYGNQPQYSYQAFNGCGGIGIFLAEYGRQTGNEAALELAAEANLWCSTVELEGYERGLLVGRTGPALSWLYLSKVTGEPPSEHCHINAQTILCEDPGPFTDLMGGAASKTKIVPASVVDYCIVVQGSQPCTSVELLPTASLAQARLEIEKDAADIEQIPPCSDLRWIMVQGFRLGENPTGSSKTA